MKWAKFDEKMFVGRLKLVKNLKKKFRASGAPPLKTLLIRQCFKLTYIYKKFITIFAGPPIIYICMNMEYGIWSEIHIFKNWYKNVSNPGRKSNLAGLFNLNQKNWPHFSCHSFANLYMKLNLAPPKKIFWLRQCIVKVSQALDRLKVN